MERLKFVIAIELLCLSGMDELCYIPWYVKRFFFLACGAFCKAGNERYIASGMRPSESHQCIRKAGILEKGETRIPLGAVKFYFTSRRPTAALFLPSLAYRLAQEEPMNSPQDCSLHGSSHHTTDDPLLGEDVDDKHRGHGHQVGAKAIG